LGFPGFLAAATGAGEVWGFERHETLLGTGFVCRNGAGAFCQGGWEVSRN
jgi:hypothetical protein